MSGRMIGICQLLNAYSDYPPGKVRWMLVMYAATLDSLVVELLVDGKATLQVVFTRPTGISLPSIWGSCTFSIGVSQLAPDRSAYEVRIEAETGTYMITCEKMSIVIPEVNLL